MSIDATALQYSPALGQKYDRIQVNIFKGRADESCSALFLCACRCIQLIAIQYEDRDILCKDRMLELTVLMSHCTDISDMI